MERKTKHRILGILVVIGLVIILLPLFQMGGNIATEKTLVKAPPFPGQAVDAAPDDTIPQAVEPVTPPASTAVSQHPDDTIVNPPTDKNEEVKAPDLGKPPVMPVTPPASSPADIPDDEQAQAKSDTQTAANESPVPASSDEVIDSANSSQKADKAAQETPPQTPPPAVKKVRRVSNFAQAGKALHAATDSDALFKAKNQAWVIQIGVFKNKSNALRLVNRLRVGGYRAFMQQNASTTRVYVGPETKQKNARTLARQLESDMNIRGIVITYKPLAL